MKIKNYKKDDTAQALPGQWKHRAKKNLGQNFLKSKEALRVICEAGKVTSDDFVIEIGPGKGVLTEEILKRGASVLAIEKDRDLIGFLNEKFFTDIKYNCILSNPKLKTVEFDKKIEDKCTLSIPELNKRLDELDRKLEIIEGDCLDFDPDTYFKEKFDKFNKKNKVGLKNLENKEIKYKIVANIPYNITGAIIKKFLSEVENKPELMALLVQKEVAERIVVRDGKESILSLSVKAYAEPKYIMKVSKKYFSPAPKVDSAIILIDNISNNNFKNKKEEEFFFKIIKAGFSHKRKVLIKNLETNLEIDKEILYKIFKKININEKSRAEDLNFEKWKKLNIEMLVSL